MNIKKYLPAIIISVSLLVIFILTGFMIKNVKDSVNNVKEDIKFAEEQAAKLEVYKEFFSNATSFSDEKAETLKDGKNEVVSSVTAYNGDTEIGIIYLVKVEGYQPDFYINVAIDTVNRKIVNFKYVQYGETYLDKLTDSFKNQFVSSDITNPSLNYNPNAGVTFSSKGIINAVMLARAAFYNSIGEEVPVIKATLISIKSSFKNAKEFDCVVEKGGNNYNVVLKYESNKFTHVSGMEDFTEEETAFVLTAAKSKLPKVYLNEVKENSIVVYTKGFGGTILVEYTIADGSVTNIAITKSAESYDDHYNDIYSPSNGDPIKDFANNVLGNDNWENYNVSGATITTSALKDSYKFVLEYLAEEGK